MICRWFTYWKACCCTSSMAITSSASTSSTDNLKDDMFTPQTETHTLIHYASLHVLWRNDSIQLEQQLKNSHNAFTTRLGTVEKKTSKSSQERRKSQFDVEFDICFLGLYSNIYCRNHYGVTIGHYSYHAFASWHKSNSRWAKQPLSYALK